MIGTNVDPGNFTDLDALARDIAAAGFTWVRSVFKPSSSDWVLACHDHDLKMLLVVARESPQEPPHISVADAYQIGNEADHQSASSWTLIPWDLSQMGRMWRQILPATTLVCSGMVSGHPEYLDSVDLSVFDVLAVHPYGRHPAGWADWGFGPVADLVDQYKRFGKPIWITEFGAPAKDFTGGQGTRADYYGRMTAECAELYAAVFPFKWEDAGVPGFGMVGTPALAAVSAVALTSRQQASVPALDEPTHETNDVNDYEEGVWIPMKNNMTPAEREASITAKINQLKDDHVNVGTVYKKSVKAGSTWAFTDAGIIIAEPGVPGAYLLKDFP